MIFKQKISEEIWKQKYRYKDETPEEHYKRVADTVFDNNIDRELAYLYLKNHNFSFGGRIMYGVGTDRKNVTFSNCYVIPILGDNIHDILKAERDATLTMKAGGGCGYDFSILRPKGAKILSSGEPSSGAVSFIHSFDAKSEIIKAGGNRRAASLASLGVWHPDIIEYIEAKRTGKLTNFNISVAITDEFMQAVKEGKKWSLIFPDYEAKPEEYNKEWDGNIEKWKAKGYPIKVYSVINARELYEKIIKSNYDYAEPGVLFIDTINSGNPLNYAEYISATNPCGEVPLAPYGSCNLGSINLASLVTEPFTENAKLDLSVLSEAVRFLVIGLDNVLDINYYPLEEQKREVMMKRQLGIGITGLADMLAMLGLRYNSEEGIKVAQEVMEKITNEAYLNSAIVAKSKGSFPLFDKDKYLAHPFIQKLDKEVRDVIEECGLRNCKLISIAPTGTISLVMNNISSGIEPIFSLEYNRKVKDVNGDIREETVTDYAWYLYKEKFGSEEKPDYFVITEDLEVEDHIKMQAALQKWVDNSISKTINIPVDYPYEKFKEVYWIAWENRLKGCTTYRPNDIIGNVLSTTTKKEDTKLPIPEEIDVGSVVVGMSYEVKGHIGESNWITVNTDDYGNPMQIFITLPKESGMDDTGNFNPKLYFDRLSDTNFIARLISLCLRHGIPVEKIIKQADKSSYNMFNLSYKLRNILLDFVYEESESVKKFLMCPECGGKLIREAGCMKCIDCGYDKCG